MALRKAAPETSSAGGSATPARRQAALTNFFASSPKLDSTGDETRIKRSKGKETVPIRPGPVSRHDSDGLLQVTEMAGRMDIGTEVTSDQVRRAMRVQVSVKVPSTPKIGSGFAEDALIPPKSTSKNTTNADSKKATQSSASARNSSGAKSNSKSAASDQDVRLMMAKASQPDSTKGAGAQSINSTSRPAVVPILSSNVLPTILTSDVVATSSAMEDVDGASSDEPVSALGLAVNTSSVVTSALQTPAMFSPAMTPTLSAVSDDGAPIDRKRRRTRRIVNPAATAFLLDDDDEDEPMEGLAAGRKRARGKVVLSSDDEDYVPDEKESDESDASDDGDVPEDEDDEEDVLAVDVQGLDDVPVDDTRNAWMKEAFLKVDLESDGDEEDAVEVPKKGRGTSQTTTTKRKVVDKNATSAHGIAGISPGKGPDFSLPPLTSIETIFDDMVFRATEFEQGLKDAVSNLQNTTLRVATMCSGTESPLLALSLINSSLEMMGLPPVMVDHQFSAEIEPFKQAYIDRNFRVPILFRDVVEMATSGCTRATTAYGSLVDIPGEVDMLVVGFSCVDYSNLNNYKKSMEEMGQSGATFKAVLTYAQIRKPKVIVVENVDGAEWDKIKKCFSDVGYAARHARVDTKWYYLPQTRCRGYMVCLLKEVFGKTADEKAERWASLMDRLKRKTSAAFRDFILPDDDHRIRKARWERAEAAGNTILWEACQGRHEAERVTERLGRKRELLKWVDGGSCIAPEYADKLWLGRMPERVWDLMELLNLKSALRHAFDFQFKSQVFDLSQNPDRINQMCPTGLASCVTPRGMLYVGDKGRCLTGYEMLSLQGIPIDRISLSHETDDELKDLAGNAMTSTVVGAAIIAALVVGWKGLRKDVVNANAMTEPIHDSLALALPANLSSLMTSSSVLDALPPSAIRAGLSTWTPWPVAKVTEMLADAHKSARMCYCEGLDAVTHHPIQICRLCRHSTCVQCGKRPAHEYGVWRGGRLTVQEWRRRWGSGWPVRVSIRDAALMDGVESGGEDIRSRLQEVASTGLRSALSLVRFRRGPVWKVEYESVTARLEIHLSEHRPMMYLFIKPDRTLAADDSLRLLVEKWPVARAVWPTGMFDAERRAKEVDLDAQWSWLDLPEGGVSTVKKQTAGRSLMDALGMGSSRPGADENYGIPPDPRLPTISIKSSSAAFPSARSRMGLVDFATEVQPRELTIDASKHDSVVEIGDRISGQYILLPECGTAFASLYKRLEAKTDRSQSDLVSGDEMYILLESTPLGNGSNDRFVFSRFPGRFEYRVVRPVVAVLQQSWRPWEPPKGVKVAKSDSANADAVTLDWEWTVRLDMPGRYVNRETVVSTPAAPLGVRAWATDTPAICEAVIAESMPDQSCLRPMPLLALRLQLPDIGDVPSSDVTTSGGPSRHGIKKQYALSDPAFSTVFGWAFLAVRAAGRLGEWHNLNMGCHGVELSAGADPDSFSACVKCAPPKPTIRWCPKPGRGLAKAALKGLKAGKGTSGAVAMAAGNGGQLVPTEDAREAGEYEARVKALPEKVVAWVNTGRENQASSSFGVEFSDDGTECTLTVSASLTMMAHQAISRLLTDTLKLAFRHGLVDQPSISARWRVETDYIPSSSAALPPFTLDSNADDVPADQPSEFLLPLRMDQRRSLAWMRRMESGSESDQARPGIPFDVFDSDEACAPSVNWRVEVRAQARVWARGGVVADQVSYGKTVTSLALILGDKDNDEVIDPRPGLVRTPATLVVCPRHLTAQWRGEVNKFLPADTYNKAGAVLEITSPGQMLSTKGRAIANAKIVILAWDVLAHDAYVDGVVNVLGADSEPASRAGRAFADFCSSVADKVAVVGEQLGEDAILDSGVGAPTTGRGRKAGPKSGSGSGGTPTLLQFFHFRRVIVDEFSYLAEHKGTKPGIFAQLAGLSSSSRWLLSGTPPLASFSDIDRMARLLGFSLGAQLPTPADLRALGRDQHSKTEIFSAFQQTRSPTWHSARHSLAQKFLRTFVRQNEARLDDPIDGVSCFNYIVPLKLAPVHRAVYLELAQHVNAMDMKLKKANDSSDRAGRLNRSLAGCNTAEEALLNCAAAFDPRVTVETVLRAREQGVREIKAEIKSNVDRATEMKALLKSDDTHFEEWRLAVSHNSVGDPAVTTVFRGLFSDADKRVRARGVTKEKANEKLVRELRDVVVGLRILTKEITMRMRSLRFLRNVRLLAGSIAGGTGGNDAPVEPPGCSNPACQSARPVPLDKFRILSFCGHIVCALCDDTKPDAESCPVQGCAAHSHENAVVTLSDLADTDGDRDGDFVVNTTPTESFGAKLDHAADLINAMPADERALLFVPTDTLAVISARMCRARGIPCAVVDSSYSSSPVMSSTSGGMNNNSNSPTSAISAFLAPGSKIKLLILNHSSESAAGTNLVRANHVLFLSPTLAPSQQAYEARMRQAIGRARRYGQKLPVHVYLYAACRTIDVDVWEMRERRGVVVHSLPRPVGAAAGQPASMLSGLPGKVNGFVRDKIRRAHVYEYFPPELSIPRVVTTDPTAVVEDGGSGDGDGAGNASKNVVAVAPAPPSPSADSGNLLADGLPQLEPVRLARVSWRGRQEIALVPRGVLDSRARASDDNDDADVDVTIPDAGVVVNGSNGAVGVDTNGTVPDDSNDSLPEAVEKANAVVAVGNDRFTSLIKFSAAFQGV